MLLAASIATSYAGVDWSVLPWAYTKPAIAVCFTFLLVAVFLRLVVMAREKADQPIRGAIAFATERSQLLILPAIITPLFLAGFTATKTSMARLAGFRWDAFFADIDFAIFGTDPWRWTHALIGEPGTAALGVFYTLVWGFTLAFAKALIAIYGSRRFVATFYLAMFATWLVAGFILAYLFTSAGPVFAHLIDPVLGERFAPLVAQLDGALSAEASVRTTQGYLGSAIFTTEAVKGGGVSAMPSMHIGAAMILLLAARGTLWVWPASLFLALTWVGSVHFGYHYAIDGIPSVIVAMMCWRVAEMFYRSKAAPMVSAAMPIVRA